MPDADKLRASEALLAGRRFADLSADEQATYRRLRNQEADAAAQRFVDNLNRHTRRD